MNKPRIQMASQCEQLPDEIRNHPQLRSTYACVGPTRIGDAVVVVHSVGAPTPRGAYLVWLEAAAAAQSHAPQIERVKHMAEKACDLADEAILRAKGLSAG